MQVTFLINGREAIPLRATPFVTSWTKSPDEIVKALATPKTVKIGDNLEIRDRYHDLFAYKMDAQGNYVQIAPSQWKMLEATLNSLSARLKADRGGGTDAANESYCTWQIESVLNLPNNIFVWLDEFQRWHERNLVEDDEAALCLTPVLFPNIEGKLWHRHEHAETAALGLPSKTEQLLNSLQKPWEIVVPGDPAPEQPWYTVARYFARQLIIEDSTLLSKKQLLANKVAKQLISAGIKNARGKIKFSTGTILKAFSNVSLG